MRRVPIIVAAIGVLTLCGSLALTVNGIAAPTERTRPTHPSQLDFESLTYRPPKLRLRSLSNGLRYGVLEDPSLPRVEGVLIFEAGSIDDPPEAVGLAEVVGELLRTGGSLTRPAEDVDEEIDFMGASVEVSTGAELTVVRFWALSQDFERVLALVSDLIRNPAFREDRLVLALDQLRESIRRRWDDPGSIASERFADLVYGEKSRWARRPTERSLDQIGQDACRRFHATAYVPARAWLGIAGDVKERAARRSIRRLFESWNARSTATRKPEVSRGAGAGLY
ncbi:MAG: pitrilysin family protein, partial [Acidobacteriota bacterium]